VKVAQRHSEYARPPLDRYCTPQWCYDQLYAVDPRFEHAVDVAPVDDDSFDFLTYEWPTSPKFIATNPPYGKLAEKFYRRALEVTKPVNGAVAMLLPHAFDTAKGRVDLWGHPFSAKLGMTQRIRWTNLPQKEAGPSLNHAWYCWSWEHYRVKEIRTLRESGETIPAIIKQTGFSKASVYRAIGQV
jgi:hypothetical protein